VVVVPVPGLELGLELGVELGLGPVLWVLVVQQ
jgi:hypothetical protein